MTMSDPRTPPVSPFCVHLASKKMMISERPPLEDSDVLDSSQHCWCELSHMLIGPDGDAAHPEDCRKGRDCFESPLADLL